MSLEYCSKNAKKKKKITLFGIFLNRINRREGISCGLTVTFLNILPVADALDPPEYSVSAPSLFGDLLA